SISRIPRTMRATHPVCSISVSRRLAKRSDARQEIVFPQKKYFLQLPNNRSTRIQEGQTNQPHARYLSAVSHDTSGFRYCTLLRPAPIRSWPHFSGAEASYAKIQVRPCRSRLISE